jgi:hypothetical protein
MRGLIVIASLCLASPALAGYDSAYTDFDLGKCKEIVPAPKEGEGEGSAVYQCEGYNGIPVTFVEGDLRSFMAYGENGQDHCGFHQTLFGFNSVSKKIEWRLKDGEPIATILRWTVSYDPENSEKTKTWLIVSKLADGNSCQMGFVEGAYPKANEKARWLADTAAEVFECKVGQTVFFANPGTDINNVGTQGGCEE